MTWRLKYRGSKLDKRYQTQAFKRLEATAFLLVPKVVCKMEMFIIRMVMAPPDFARAECRMGWLFSTMATHYQQMDSILEFKILASSSQADICCPISCHN